MTDVLRLTAVTKRYEREGPVAVDGVTLRVGAAEAVAVTGPSGSGKSTVLSLVAGLDRPTGGTVEVAGQNLGRLSETALARFRRAQIGIIFQFFHLLDDLTVRDNVLLPARLAGERSGVARIRADELLEKLGIGGRGHDYPGQLSGGERQRVARALVNRPALLLADEPTGAVVADLLREIGEGGQAMLPMPCSTARCGGW
jgi:putative ABC transport system ATP-binding protein